MTVCILTIDLIRHISLNGVVSLKDGYFRKHLVYEYSALEISGLNIIIAIRPLVKNKNANAHFSDKFLKKQTKYPSFKVLK